jgi:hypothetical protein
MQLLLNIAKIALADCNIEIVSREAINAKHRILRHTNAASSEAASDVI